LIALVVEYIEILSVDDFMATNYVVIGGGDLAVEVVTYLCEIQGGVARDVPLFADIVSNGRIRLAELTCILGSTPCVYGNVASIPSLAEKSCVIAVGDPQLRYRFMREVESAGGRLRSVVHPTAYVASTATVGEGAIIGPMAFVGPFAKVGRNCVINVHAVVGHDVVLGDCAVLSPGSNVNGHGVVGEGAFLGAGAIVSPKASLGAFGKLSAGSVLNRVTEEGFLMHGNPAVGRQMFRRP
jgi:sugar O-acyltransferase (sialic acid O-acetyltransferase NeuD family)